MMFVSCNVVFWGIVAFIFYMLGVSVSLFVHDNTPSLYKMEMPIVIICCSFSWLSFIPFGMCWIYLKFFGNKID